MKVYLAGKIRGKPNYFETFASNADKLRREGHYVFNPAAANLEGMSLPKIMAFLIPQLCECDAIAMIPWWWTRFGGAWIEWLLAKYLGLKIIYLR